MPHLFRKLWQQNCLHTTTHPSLPNSTSARARLVAKLIRQWRNIETLPSEPVLPLNTKALWSGQACSCGQYKLLPGSQNGSRQIVTANKASEPFQKKKANCYREAKMYSATYTQQK